jgi:hypothetical protein
MRGGRFKGLGVERVPAKLGLYSAIIEQGAMMNDKIKIITMLREEFNRWEELLHTISEEQITASNFIANMSIKDVVAHLTVWQQINIARLEAAGRNTEPEYPKRHPEFDPETEEELAKINAWIYENRHEQSWSDVHREWKERFFAFWKWRNQFLKKTCWRTESIPG